MYAKRVSLDASISYTGWDLDSLSLCSKLNYVVTCMICSCDTGIVYE